MKSLNANPWYREPWPWILMAGPAIVVVAGFYMLWLATESNDGLVEDDYYKQGLGVNQRMARDQLAVERGYQAEVLLATEGTGLRLRLVASDPAAMLPERVRLKLAHPTRSGSDQEVELQADGQGFYAGRFGQKPSGRWNVILEDVAQSWRLTGEWRITADTPLLLGDAKGSQNGLGTAVQN